MKKIALGSDHAGYALKEKIKSYLRDQGHEAVDFGTFSAESVDYPDFISPAARCVARGDCELGIVFGGSGNGEAMVANKLQGIRCALCWNEESARLAKEHNNANVIALGARLISEQEALKIVDTWLSGTFQGGRHQRRIEKMD